jgi:hypothetical protein
MYRRAFAAADLSLAVGGLLLLWGFLRPPEDVQRLYGFLLGLAALLVGSVQLAGRHGPVRGRRPDGLATAPAAVAGGPGRGGDRVDRLWYRHGRGGDHQPRSPIRIRARARVRPSTRSRYGASDDRFLIRFPAGRRDGSGYPGGEGEAGTPVTVVSLPGRGAGIEEG